MRAISQRRLAARVAASGNRRAAGRSSRVRSRPTTAPSGSAHSLPRLLDATRPWRDVVEVVVCDNASTDETPEVVSAFRGEQNFASVPQPDAMSACSATSARLRGRRSGAFVWLLGDDDLLVEGAIENVLEGLAAHPHVEMAYMNYAYTAFDDPARLQDADEIIANATPIADGGPNRYVRELRRGRRAEREPVHGDLRVLLPPRPRAARVPTRYQRRAVHFACDLRALRRVRPRRRCRIGRRGGSASRRLSST